MKDKVHPKYYPKATIKCICGNTMTVGSTAPKTEIEICAACHPFFSGKEKLIDTAGRVEKFRQKVAKSKILKSTIPAPKGKKAGAQNVKKESPAKKKISKGK